MFGVVPKSLWSRSIDCDESNQIPQATNCLLARNGDRCVLVDTGYGGKLSDKQRRWMNAEEGDPLLASLATHGLHPDDVTDVVFSHLHYDHAGGASLDDGDQVRPAFPNATHYVQQLEWDVAHSDAPELRGAYPRENLTPLADVGWSLVNGEVDLLPGLSVFPTPGHTLGHQAVRLETASGPIAYLGDLVPTSHHLPLLWCMAYDVELLTTRRSKLHWLGMAVEQQWEVVFNHDVDCPKAKVQRDDRKGFAILG